MLIKNVKSELVTTLTFDPDESDVNIEDIIRIEGDVNYSYVHTAGKKLIFTKSLKYFERELNHDYFLRIHKSHIVNMNHAKKMGDSNEYKLLKTSDGEELGISRRKSKIVRSFFENQ